MSKWIPVCKDCGTMNLVVDAWVVWDTVADQWVVDGVSDVYDSSQCYNEECASYEEEVNIDWVLPEDVKPTSQDALDAKVERF